MKTEKEIRDELKSQTEYLESSIMLFKKGIRDGIEWPIKHREWIKCLKWILNEEE